MTATASVCRSCGAPILWGTTPAGKALPLDARPSPEGNVTVNDDGRAVALTRGEAELHRRAGKVLYLAHFATCPAATKHRKGER